MGVPAGTTYTATASKPGFTSASVSPLTVSGNASTQVAGLTLNVTPYPVGGTITVQGLTTGSYAGVSAVLSGVAFDGESYSTSAVLTNSAGAFSISNVPAGTYSVTLTNGTSYTPLVISPVIVGSGSSATALTGTLLRATGTFTGSVAVAPGGTSLTMNATDPGGFAVVVSDASFGTTTYSAVTSTAGVFTIAGIPAPLTPTATYLITASKAGFTNATTNVVLNPTVSATAAGTITANVAPYGLNATAAVVSPATSPAGTTATISGVAFNGSVFSAGSSTCGDRWHEPAPGGFHVREPADEQRHVYADLRRHRFRARHAPIAVPSTSTPAVTFSARSTGTVTGTVTVSNGGTGLTIAGNGQARHSRHDDGQRSRDRLDDDHRLERQLHVLQRPHDDLGHLLQ